MTDGITEKLKWFWDKSPAGEIIDALGGAVDVVIGASDKLSGLQKTVIKKLWEDVAAGSADLDRNLVVNGSTLLQKFGIPVDESVRIMSSLISSVPNIPILRPILVAVAAISFFVSIPIKGFAAGYELIDKNFRRTLKPTVGSYNDLLTAYWRTGNPDIMPGLQDDTGLAPEWRGIVGMASQWWPDLSQIQELYRRGVVDDSSYQWMLGSIGLWDDSIKTQVSELAWSVPDISTVLELFRRLGLDQKVIAPYLRKAGFQGADGDAMLAAAIRLIELPNLFELRRRGVLRDDEYKVILGQYGYEPEDRDKVGQLYQRLPDSFQLTQMYFRKLIGKNDYLAGLGQLGYDPKLSDKLEQTAWQLPGPADLMRFGVREVFTPEIAARFGQYQQYPSGITAWANKIGMAEDVAKMYWAAHWDLPSIGQMFDMYHRGIIPYTDLKMGVRAQDVMPFWQDKVIELSYNQIPRRTLPGLVRQGLIGGSALTLRFRKLGYSPEDAVLMSKSAQIDAVEAQRDLTKSDIVAALAQGWFTEQEAREALAGLHYSQTSIDYFVAEGLRRLSLTEAKATASQVTTDAAEALSLTAAEILKGYKEGVIDRTTAATSLSDLDLSPEAITFKLTLVELQRVREHKEALAKQYKRLFESHLIDEIPLMQSLYQAGYTAIEADNLLKEWTLERTVDTAVKTIRDRLPSVADLESWLKLGIIDTDTWVDAMARHGYDDDAVANYLFEIMVKTKAG